MARKRAIGTPAAPAAVKWIWGWGRGWEGQNWEERIRPTWGVGMVMASTARSYALLWAGESDTGLLESPPAMLSVTRVATLWGPGFPQGKRTNVPFPREGLRCCCRSCSHFDTAAPPRPRQLRIGLSHASFSRAWIFRQVGSQNFAVLTLSSYRTPLKSCTVFFSMKFGAKVYKKN